jgi:glycosyltransferase involved in cell wall biosynthesis
MRIAMVSEHASPLAALGGEDAGGQNVHVAALGTALARRGHNVTIYTRRDSVHLPGRVEQASGVYVEHVPAGPPTDMPKDEILKYIGEFGSYLDRRWALEPPDLVHTHFWMSALAGLSGTRRFVTPVVHTFHALGSVKRRYQRAKDTSPPERLRLEKAIGHSVDHVIATSNDEVAELIRMGVPRLAISVVPCGVDVELFTPAGPAAPRGSARHRLVSLGRLVERKGVDDIIRALRVVPSAELVVAGGPDASMLDADPEVVRLRGLAGECGVGDRVAFIGRVAREEVPALLRSADLVVCVPWYEPFGIVPLEAMACGVPVVASAVGGLTDTIIERTTGALVPPRRPDLLAHRLRELLGDPVRREAYGVAGVDRVRARFTWERIAAETEAVYADVLAKTWPAASRLPA